MGVVGVILVFAIIAGIAFLRVYVARRAEAARQLRERAYAPRFETLAPPPAAPAPATPVPPPAAVEPPRRAYGADDPPPPPPPGW